MSNLKTALSQLALIVFPKRCALCGEVIELTDKLCERCRNISKIKAPICEFCGASSDDCTCKKHKNEYKRVVAPYYYEDSMISAIHRFKSSDMTFLADSFAFDMLTVINDNYCDIVFDYVTFVPLRKFKERCRGYNQSQLLARKISSALGVELLPLLKKVRYTGVQHYKSAKARKADVFGAYDVSEKYAQSVNGKTILLIDDVRTTGSTLNECAKMLKIYGANSVYCATVCISIKK